MPEVLTSLRLALVAIQLLVIWRLLRSPLRTSLPVFGAFATAEAVSRMDFQPLRSFWIHTSWSTLQLPLLILTILVVMEAGVHATTELDPHERWLLICGILTVGMIPLILLSFPGFAPILADSSSLYFQRLLNIRRAIHGWAASVLFITGLYCLWMPQRPRVILPHVFLLGGYFTLYLGTESPPNFVSWLALRKTFLIGAIGFWVGWVLLFSMKNPKRIRQGV